MSQPAMLWGDDMVLLTRRGAEICYAALVAAERKFATRNGGASPTDEMQWLREVLRLATMAPERFEPVSAGRAVVVNVAERNDLPDEGSAVAAAGSAPSVSEAGRARGCLDTRSAAQLLGISDRAVRKACDRGWLRAERVAGHWLIDEADALAYRGRREGRIDDRQAAAVG